MTREEKREREFPTCEVEKCRKKSDMGRQNMIYVYRRGTEEKMRLYACDECIEEIKAGDCAEFIMAD